MPEAALRLWLEICPGLAQQRPVRKVLSNVLWFRLARVTSKVGSGFALPFSRTYVNKRYLLPALLEDIGT